MPTLPHNITKLQQRITAACAQNQRCATNVLLLAVSKTQSMAKLQEAYDLGLRHFGENYVSEALEKVPALPKDIIWHFIGPLQSNKTRFIAENFHWLHSLDRLKIAQRLNEQRGEGLAPLNCLIQINISDDANKSGIHPAEMMEFAQEILKLPHLQLRGLMTIPKAEQSLEDLEKDFANMAQLLRQLRVINEQADTLSMGMSGDMELAIRHGSTLVRIGTDLFGARH